MIERRKVETRLYKVGYIEIILSAQLSNFPKRPVVPVLPICLTLLVVAVTSLFLGIELVPRAIAQAVDGIRVLESGCEVNHQVLVPLSGCSSAGTS